MIGTCYHTWSSRQPQSTHSRITLTDTGTQCEGLLPYLCVNLEKLVVIFLLCTYVALELVTIRLN